MKLVMKVKEWRQALGESLAPGGTKLGGTGTAGWHEANSFSLGAQLDNKHCFTANSQTFLWQDTKRSSQEKDNDV